MAKRNSDLEVLDNPWKQGLPPGKADPEKYEVYFSPIGIKWHRRKIKQDFSTRESDLEVKK